MILLNHLVIIVHLIIIIPRMAISNSKTEYSRDILLLGFGLWRCIWKSLQEHVRESGTEVGPVNTGVSSGLWSINIFTVRTE